MIILLEAAILNESEGKGEKMKLSNGEAISFSENHP